MAFAGRRAVVLVLAGGEARGGTRASAPDRAPLEGRVGRLVSLGRGRVLPAVASGDGVRLGRRRGTAHAPLALAAGGRPGWRGWRPGARCVLPGSRRRVIVAPRGLRSTSSGWRLAAGLAVVESWLDRHGGYHSVVRAGARSLRLPGSAASGGWPTPAAQVLAFKSCDSGGRCWVRVAYRQRRGGYWAAGPRRCDRPRPIAGGSGERRREGGRRLGLPRRGVRARAHRGARRARWAGAGYASALALAGGPGGEVAAVWTQGTAAPSVVGAVLR